MLLFFTSPIGLGHATRNIAIANKLAQSESNCTHERNSNFNDSDYDGGSSSSNNNNNNSDDDNNNNSISSKRNNILFISGLGAAKLIEKNGYAVLDLYRPEKFVVQNGQLQQSFRWLMDYYSYYKKCKDVATGIITSKDNDGLVVSDEDFASISAAQELNRKRILITDILETHFTKGAASLIEKKMNSSMKSMIRKCDRVIIPDFGQDHDNISYVGPIVREASADRDTLRKRFDFTRKTIIVSVGGTDAGSYLIERSVDAYRKLQARLDVDLVIVSGPSLRLPKEFSDLRNLGFVDNLHELIYAADLVISLAGRSTMDESIAYGTPGIFIPIKGHFEQEEGAKRLGYTFTDIDRLDSLIEEKILQGASGSNNNNNGNDDYGSEKVSKRDAKTMGVRSTFGAQKAAEIIQSFTS